MQFKRRVAEGYDICAGRLDRERGLGSVAARWLARLTETLPPSARLLDLGCGAGTPHTSFLAERFDVVGVDISSRQLHIASARVPQADFILADMSSLHFPDGSFQAITAIYSIIHVPREEQARLFASIRRWLKPSGTALLVLGANDTPYGEESDWFGAPMLWSHYDAETNLEMLRDARLRVMESAQEPDPTDSNGRQLFVICRAV